MITKENVKRISELALINIKNEEIDDYVNKLSDILDYFKQLDEVNTDGVKPTYHVEEINNIFREDVVKKSLPQNSAIENAKSKENGYIKIPRII
ncbi:MAG: Asp-tRNA(Asn)/Glu-tRNA(Gln) amidotransferase subunit GatC [Methanosarcinales archaeon]|nr:Asp-tRNA(Asn)/Glu-tRNA(Gln) amidotransferase subunit GatC [Methanosarcinales archaeon]